MPMSTYYQELRGKIGTQRIFNPAVAAIIRNACGEILFQRPSRESEIWSLPAGAIELGETPADAVKREVYEETGLQVRPHQLVGVFGGESFRYTYPDGNQVEYFVCVFACVVESGTLDAVDGESAELAYFPVSSMPKLALPYPKEILSLGASDRTLFQLS